jgi:hypothetical protein
VAFDAAGYEWVTSHIAGRKTVATLMDKAGLSARQAADQLGVCRVCREENFSAVNDMNVAVCFGRVLVFYASVTFQDHH